MAIDFERFEPIGEERLRDAERRLGFELPPAYRRWLAETGGGKPAVAATFPGRNFIWDQRAYGVRPDQADADQGGAGEGGAGEEGADQAVAGREGPDRAGPDQGRADQAGADQAGAGQAGGGQVADLANRYRYFADRLPPAYLPVASVHGGLLAVKATGEGAGSVWFWDSDEPGQPEDGDVEEQEALLQPCGTDWDDFLARLVPSARTVTAEQEDELLRQVRIDF